MPDLHEFELVLHLVERADQAVDAVAGKAENAPHAPLVKTLPDEFGNGLRHGGSPWLCAFLASIRKRSGPRRRSEKAQDDALT